MYCDLKTSFFRKDNTNCIRFFYVSNFFIKWANLWLLVNVQDPKVFQLQGGLRPRPLTGGSAPGLRPRPPFIGASHLYLGGHQLSNAGTAGPVNNSSANHINKSNKFKYTSWHFDHVTTRQNWAKASCLYSVNRKRKITHQSMSALHHNYYY